MPYNYSKLRGKIIEIFGTQEKFANAIKLNRATVNLKLNGKSEWSQSEMEMTMELIHEPISKTGTYFFSK